MIVTNHAPIFDMTSFNLESGKIHILPNNQFHVKQLFTLDEIIHAYHEGLNDGALNYESMVLRRDHTTNELRATVELRTPKQIFPSQNLPIYQPRKPKPRYRIHFVDLGKWSLESYNFKFVGPFFGSQIFMSYNPTTGIAAYFYHQTK
jgi:hypothetical protein